MARLLGALAHGSDELVPEPQQHGSPAPASTRAPEEFSVAAAC